MRLILALCLLILPQAALACGQDSDCVIGDRTYRLYLPETTKPMGALLFAHGYRGSAAGEMRNKGLRQIADDMGLALIALKSGGEDWNLAHRPRAPQQEDAQESDYVKAVLADAATRFDMDPSRVVMAGFSAGGMMTWTIACEMSQPFAGFVPMSGTFWTPVPKTCAAPPANVVHIHGTTDKTVPLTGRKIGETSQGDVSKTLQMYASLGGFANPHLTTGPAGMTCTKSTNSQSILLEFCTFAGGHEFNAARLRYGVEQVLGSHL
jgi:polyhydroxybutyrate depolymerase